MWDSVSPNTRPQDTGSPSAGQGTTGMPWGIKSTAKGCWWQSGAMTINPAAFVVSS